MMGFHVHNLGCKVNRVESDTLIAELLSHGVDNVALDEATVVLINTCTVTAEADSKARKAVRKALAAAQSPQVIVTGCAAVIDPQMFAELGANVRVIPDKQAAAAAALALLVDSSLEVVPIRRTGAGFPTRMGIKIQDGCDNRCSYCIVSTARGPARSVPITQILSQVQEAESSGVREIVLTGINLGRFSDCGQDLTGLLKILIESTTTMRFRLSSIEPPNVDSELAECISSADGRICAHLHLPLQSGSDTVLARMGRSYDISSFRDRVAALRSSLPHLALTTDVIVGFPGETEEEFQQTLDFCKQIAFAKIHVFRYSVRKGTPAATMPDQVAPTIKAERAQILRDLAADLRKSDAQNRIGTLEAVLVEAKGRATSDSYYTVKVPGGVPAGELVKMQFVSYRDNLMEGTVL